MSGNSVDVLNEKKENIYNSADVLDEKKENIYSRLIDELANNDAVFCKSQQRDEMDMTKNEKVKFLTDIFEKSKSNFLFRFGQFLTTEQVEYFENFQDDPNDGYETMYHVRNILRMHSKRVKHTYLRNRRYSALKRLVEKNSYFSETEMMKRNPLLYEQLVGRYLSNKEKRQRDYQNDMEHTFVGVLMDGIEREHTEAKRRKQQAEENIVIEEEDSSESEDEEDGDNSKPSTSCIKPENKPIRTLWGEIQSDTKQYITAKRYSDIDITADERKILKEEFVSSMYENFLDGKDDDFDYNTVDNNEEYDDLQILEKDEEEKYFDSEEPEDMKMEDDTTKHESSEDELDIYMNALNQHPVVCKLSEELKKL